MNKSKSSEDSSLELPKPYIIINKDECKGCERCVIGCKKNVIELCNEINNLGYNYAKYVGDGCIGCGDCYYTCPEPLAIEVYIPKRKNKV